jgi:outer membrane protein W
MRINRVIFATGLALAAASPATPATESSWTLRFHGAILESTAADKTSAGNYFASSVDVGGGVGIGVEYRFSDRLGLEFSALTAGLEIGSRVSGGPLMVQSFELSMMPFTLGVPFHFHAGGRADFFVAPTFSIVRYLDIEASIGVAGMSASVDLDSDAAPGADIGIDVPFKKEGKWAFSAGLRYMRTAAGGIDVDPVIMRFGFAYRF